VRRRGIASLALVALVAIGCGPAPSASPGLATATAPPDWVSVSSKGGDIQLALPPWLVVFDNQGTIFANEPPPAPGAQLPMQMMAEGPATLEHPAVGANLAAWIDARLRDVGQGVADVARVELPAGSAVRYARTDRAGTTLAWRFLVFAIETPRGVVYLQFDGPPDGWARRAEDLELIAASLRVR
jgi:hypothetical protein